MADWSHLPKELLQLISQKLKSEIYLIRFRSVCSTWRFSTPKPHNHFPLNLPHFSDSNHSDIHKLFKHTIFLIKPPATPNQQTPYRPWLVRITPTSTGKFNLCHPLLLNSLIIPSDPPVLDFNQLSVFNIRHMYICGMLHPNSSTTVYRPYDRSVATFQEEQILDIVTHDNNSGDLLMFRSGDDGWTKIPNVPTFYQDICIFKGRPCLTDRTGRTVMIGLDLSVHLVADPVYSGDVHGNINIMVENESELLLAYKYEEYYNNYIDDYYVDERVRIDVFRLDQKQKKWLKLANLGDTVLFLGQCDSFATSALDLGFDNGNFVIYCNDNDNYDVKSEMRIFHLDQQWNSPLSDYPDYFKLFWPPPVWIVSRCL